MLEYYERKQEQERLLAMKPKDVYGGGTMDKLFNETVEMIAKIYQKEPCGGGVYSDNVQGRRGCKGPSRGCKGQ